MLLNCGVEEDLLRVPWTARRSNQSILKEISPEYSLEGLTLKLDYAKAFDCVDHNKLWKILKEMGITRPPDLPLEKSICRSGSNS